MQTESLNSNVSNLFLYMLNEMLENLNMAHIWTTFFTRFVYTIQVAWKKNEKLFSFLFITIIWRKKKLTSSQNHKRFYHARPNQSFQVHNRHNSFQSKIQPQNNFELFQLDQLYIIEIINTSFDEYLMYVPWQKQINSILSIICY